MLYNYMDHVLRGSEFIYLVIFFELFHILGGSRNVKYIGCLSSSKRGRLFA